MFKLLQRSGAEPLSGTGAVEPVVLRCEQLVKSFGGVRALRGIDLSINSGKILAVIGPNGAGKSSLVNVLTGLYKPTSGRVEFDGRDIGDLSLAARSRIGIMRTFQGTHIFKSLRVRQALALGTEAPRADVCGSLEEFAERFGLTSYLDTRVDKLPYGVQKILNLALVSASSPRVLLLDEPFAGVHAEDVTRLSAVIEGFRDSGVGLAIVEHNIEALLRIADEVIVIDSGMVIFTGGPAEARTSSVVREAYLGGTGSGTPATKEST